MAIDCSLFFKQLIKFNVVKLSVIIASVQNVLKIFK